MSLLSFIKRLVGQDDALLQAESRFAAELGKLASERAALANSGKDLQGILSTLERQKRSINDTPCIPIHPETPPSSKGT